MATGALVSCSSPQGATDVPSTGGSGGSTGVSNAGGGAAAVSGSDDLVGSFQVQVTANHEDPSTGATSVIGKVNNAAIPPTLIWTVEREVGDCRLEIPRAPFCSAVCSGGACVDDDMCVAYPEAKSVGEVMLGGVALSSGADSIVLKEVVKAYQPPPGTMFSYPPFAEGDEVSVHAAGNEYPAFDLVAGGVPPLSLTSTDFALEEAKALDLTWLAAADPKKMSVHAKLNISNHGGTRGIIQCDADDDGSLTIPAALITDLIGLGVAGFPTVVLTRASTGAALIPAGRVELVVSSKVEQFVTVAGVDSCTEDADCPDGKTCQANLTCQ